MMMLADGEGAVSRSMVSSAGMRGVPVVRPAQESRPRQSSACAGQPAPGLLHQRRLLVHGDARVERVFFALGRAEPVGEEPAADRLQRRRDARMLRQQCEVARDLLRRAELLGAREVLSSARVLPISGSGDAGGGVLRECPEACMGETLGIDEASVPLPGKRHAPPAAGRHGHYSVKA